MHETELFALERIQFERRHRRRSGIYIYTHILLYYIRIRAPGWRRCAGVTGGVGMCECGYVWVWVCGWVNGWGEEGGRANVTRRRYIKRVIGLQKRVPAHRSPPPLLWSDIKFILLLYDCHRTRDDDDELIIRRMCKNIILYCRP